MFKGTSAFDQDISGWDVSKVCSSSSFSSSTSSGWMANERPTFDTATAQANPDFMAKNSVFLFLICCIAIC